MIKAPTEACFEFLSDEPSVDDKTFHGSHRRIAMWIAKHIRTTRLLGLNIALEGRWGTGKSTVVELLKEDIKKDDDIFCFYFDAWAHEGDSLREVFLRKLIDEIDKVAASKSEESNHLLQQEKDKLEGRSIIRKSLNGTYLTGYGCLAGILGIFGIFGAIVVRNYIGDITFSPVGIVGFQTWWESLHWPFIFGTIMMFSPSVGLVYSWLSGDKVRKQFKKDGDNEKFKDSGLFDAVEKVVCSFETNGSNPKTSVAFEKTFLKLVQVLKAINISKLVLICDNLDRLDRTEVLRMWSLLQIFIQQDWWRANGVVDGVKLFTIVPYDVKELSYMLDGVQMYRHDLRNDNLMSHKDLREKAMSRAESVFHKAFNLRIHVPRLSSGDWNSTAKQAIEMSLSSYTTEERELVLNALVCSRKSPADIPTMRGIKAYCNHVGMLRQLCLKEVSLAAIAYYAAKRHIDGMTDDELEEAIIEGAIPADDAHMIMDIEDLKKELCSIIFSVSKISAIGLLLEAPISKNITDNDGDGLKLLYEVHGAAAKEEFNSLVLRGRETGRSLCSLINLSWVAFGEENVLPISNLIKAKLADISQELVLVIPEVVESVFRYSTNEYGLMASLLSRYIKSLEMAFLRGELSDTVSARQVNVVSQLKVLSGMAVVLNPTNMGFNGIKAYFNSLGGDEAIAISHLSEFDASCEIGHLIEVLSKNDPDLVDRAYVSAAKFIAQNSRGAKDWSHFAEQLKTFMAKSIPCVSDGLNVLKMVNVDSATRNHVTSILSDVKVLDFASKNKDSELVYELACHVLRFVVDKKQYEQVQYRIRNNRGYIVTVDGKVLTKYLQEGNGRFLEHIWGYSVDSSDYLWFWNALRTGALRDPNFSIVKRALASRNCEFLLSEHPYDNYLYFHAGLSAEETAIYWNDCVDKEKLVTDAIRVDRAYRLFDDLAAIYEVVVHIDNLGYFSALKDELEKMDVARYVKLVTDAPRLFSSILQRLYEYGNKQPIVCLGQNFFDAILQIAERSVPIANNANIDIIEALASFRNYLTSTFLSEFDGRIIDICFKNRFAIHRQAIKVSVESFRHLGLSTEKQIELSQIVLDVKDKPGQIFAIKEIIASCEGIIKLNEKADDIIVNGH